MCKASSFVAVPRPPEDPQLPLLLSASPSSDVEAVDANPSPEESASQRQAIGQTSLKLKSFNCLVRVHRVICSQALPLALPPFVLGLLRHFACSGRVELLQTGL